MTRLIHLSDLHYGRDDPELETPLLDTIAELDPDLVVISGDFTQRARRSQFARARAFLDRIAAPTLSVPGNHDTPLDNLFLRFLRPFHRYKRAIDRQLEPVHEGDGIIVAGVNTVNRFAWQRGRMSRHTTARVCRVFDEVPDKVQIAVLHHPLEHGPEVDKRLMKGARAALQSLAECGTDVVLSGHLHEARAQPFSTAPGLLFVQAGTGLSTRLRGEPNTFNLLDIDGSRIAVTTYSNALETANSPAFRATGTAVFERAPSGWDRVAETVGPTRAAQ
ncbi:metallophosphoesterase family protein [Mesobacterium pallidum]|uniref:metallophosphoesterase family protein n=1 Tax=Mesobacterium pallidum TaxID=2872037 RepID=UPI001EE28022|nr:metallophosphoesterase family protein [Mesobacterium pallidum]